MGKHRSAEPSCAELTVWAGLELEAGAAGSVAGGGAGSDLQQVGRVGLQTVQGHVTAAGAKDGVAGLLLLLCRRDEGGRALIATASNLHVRSA